MNEEKKKYLRLKDVGDYIYERVGVRFCKATIYNWMNNGRVNYSGKKVKLRTEKRASVNVTTEEWVDEFMEEFQSVD